MPQYTGSPTCSCPAVALHAAEDPRVFALPCSA